ncbi:MAG: PIN domain-containing protein [Planctomycetota bacterium]|jgi:uncharacterized protein YacL
MLLHVLRAVFILALVGVAMIFISREDGELSSSLFRPLEVNKDLVLLCCIGFALVIIAVDIFIPQKTLSAISGLFFGLVVGMVVAFGLSLIVDLMVKSFFPSLRTPVYADVSVKEWVRVRDPDDPSKMTTELLDRLKPEEIGSRDHPVISATKVGIGVICCYLAVSFILQTKDDVRFVIPYVEFAKQAKGMRPLVLDTSVIIDGRITDIADTGIIESEMIVPRFVLQELQTVADSGDKLKRNRGRRGLDMLNKLQLSQKAEIKILDVHAGPGEATTVDERLVELADKIDGRLVTNDYNLNKLAQLRSVVVINVNDLATALRPVYLQGEQLAIKIIKPGEEVGQGVGYLDDGTMVVVEGGREHIGESIGIVVTNVLQTSAGRMIFGRSESLGEVQAGRRRPSRSNA